MPGPLPALDKQALLKLRALAKRIRAENGRDVQSPTLVDLDAAREIGEPLLVVRAADAPVYPAWAGRLSPREREVVELVAAGLPNKSIASRLFISLATVKDHVHHILAKSGLCRRPALVSLGPRRGPVERSTP